MSRRARGRAPSGGDARYYLGIDLSTQSCTAIVVDAALDVAHRASVNFDASFPAYGTSNGMHATDDGVATSPVAMWLDGLDAVLELIPASLRQQVDGVSFSGQQHGSVYWSAAAAARSRGGFLFLNQERGVFFDFVFVFAADDVFASAFAV